VAVLRGAGVHLSDVDADDESLPRRAVEALEDATGRHG
jgi:hypothetical protein